MRELCEKHGIRDRMPRYIRPGPLGVNERVAERLFLRTYDLELERASSRRIWAYRRAAWTVEELDRPIDAIHAAGGEAGLRELPGIGRSLSGLIGRWLREGLGGVGRERNRSGDDERSGTGVDAAAP